MNKKDVDNYINMSKEYPELWYNFHYGTFSIQLKYNRRTHQYYLEWSGFNPFPQYEEYYDIVRARGNFYLKRPNDRMFEYFDIAKKFYFEHLIKAMSVYKFNI